MLWLAVALGGSLGALARYGTYTLMGVSYKGFPVATFSVNIIGSFFIGMGYILIVQAEVLPAPWRQFFIVGFLGSLTTFSTFSLETLRLFEQGEISMALAYVGASFLLGLLAVFLGVYITERMV